MRGPHSSTVPPPLDLRAAALGEVGTFPGTGGGGATLSIDLTVVPRLALGLGASWLTDFAGTDLTGSIDVHRQRFFAFARLPLRDWLQLLGGAGDLHSEATGSSATGKLAAAEDDPFAYLALELRLHLLGPLFAFSDGTALLDFTHRAYQLDEPQPVALATAPLLTFQVSLGLGLHFF